MQSPLRLVRGLAAAVILLAALIGRPAYADTLTLAWDPSTDSAVTGYLVYVGVQSGVYSQTFDTGNLTSFAYTSAKAGQRYYFAVASYSAGPTIGVKSAEVSGISNTAPIITNPGNKTSDVGQSVSLQLAGSDPDGTPVTFSATGLPAGLILTSTTGYISGAATTAGTYTVTASVSDGVLKSSVTFTWTVNATSVSAPTLVSPATSTSSSKPTYVWNAAKGAVSYVLNVDDSVTVAKVRLTISASAAGCAATTVCSVTPGIALAPGAAKWAVETLASTGSGPWSGSLSFAVPDFVAPTVTIVTPSPTIAYESTQRTLALSGVASDNGAVASVSWVNSRGGSGTATGTSSWSASILLAPGPNTITVTARDTAGNASAVSRSATYVVPPTPLTPAVTSTAMPAFMWNPAPGATSYVLSVSDSTQTDKIHMTIAADQAGCATEATCVFNPGVALAAGAAKWAVETIVSSDLNAWSAPVDFIVDTTAPVIQITSPTKSGNFTTTSGSITLAGAAGDNVGVKMVTWSDNHGNSGSAQGLYSWTTSPIALVAGSTTFTVMVADGAGNVASDSVTVNYGASTSRGKKK